MAKLPKELITALLQQTELQDEVSHLTSETYEKYKIEIGHPDLDAEGHELCARYGELYRAIGKELGKKLDKIQEDLSEVYEFIEGLPDSCYEHCYAEMVVRIKTVIDCLHIANKSIKKKVGASGKETREA